MELLKSVKRRTFWSEFAYYSLNLGLVLVLLLIARTVQSPYPALVLVLLSKWRVVAVRPRFWMANIQANLVDIIVGLGVVGFMYLPTVDLAVQIILAVFYAVWLTIIKPMSKRWQIAIQSGAAILIGTMSLMAVSYEWPVSLVVVLMFLIGYSSARHLLNSYDEEQSSVISLAWGIVFAELGWLAYYWNFSYSGAFSGSVPQVSIILILLSLCAERAYQSWKKHDKVQFSDISPPLFLTIALTFVMLVLFNSVVI